jgi:hypothetical protein
VGSPSLSRFIHRICCGVESKEAWVEKGRPEEGGGEKVGRRKICERKEGKKKVMFILVI